MNSIKKLLKLAHGSIDAFEAELIMAYFLKAPREYVVANIDLKVSPYTRWRFLRYVKKRKEGTPIQFLTKRSFFYGLVFKVSRYVLIPRPSTETMVDLAINAMSQYKALIAYSYEKQNLMLADIGTGSGCVPVSILKNLPNLVIKSTEVFATDVSLRALLVARENAKKYKVKMKFRKGNLLAPITNEIIKKKIEHLFITANLPYLTEKHVKNEKSISHEPKVALLGGQNGLALYEKLLLQMCRLIPKLNVKKITCFFEMNPDQIQKMKKMIYQYLPDSEINVIKDLGNMDRVVVVDLEKWSPAGKPAVPMVRTCGATSRTAHSSPRKRVVFCGRDGAPRASPRYQWYALAGRHPVPYTHLCASAGSSAVGIKLRFFVDHLPRPLGVPSLLRRG